MQDNEIKGKPICKEENQIKEEEEKQLITIVLEKEGDSGWPLSIREPIERDEQSGLKLTDIILKLKRQNFHDFFDSSVSYYHEEKGMYIFCFYLPKNIGEHQLAKERKYQKVIPIEALQYKKSDLHCKLKFRKKVLSKIQLLKDEQDVKYSNDEELRKGAKQKEKSIAQVIEKVALWRKLYTGFPNQRGDNVHFELEDSATEIGVIKKTLDDYLLQIRNGKRYGFNFQKMKDEKIGELRSFVKEKRTDKKK